MIEKTERRAPRGRKVSRREQIEMLDPEFRTGMLDGYAQAIASMSQRDRDKILTKIATR